jgi:negative regulator of sigma E activity
MAVVQIVRRLILMSLRVPLKAGRSNLFPPTDCFVAALLAMTVILNPNGILFSAPQNDDLSRIIAAQRQQDFAGIWVREFRHADTTLTVVRHIWHRHPDQARIEFLEPEKLQGAVLFINGESVRFAGNRHVGRFARTERGESPMFFEALRHAAEVDWLRGNYRIRVEPGEPLLGRATEHLRFIPKNPHRGRLEIWPDRATGILLRTRRFDRFDNLISTSYFREIEFAPVDSAVVALPDSLKRAAPNQVEVDNFTDLGAFIAGATDALLLPRDPPAGFHFRQVKAIHRKGKTYYHFQYSDGLTTLSLFEFSGSHDHRERGPKSKRDRRPNNEALSLVRGEKAGVAYSLLGEVAAEELEKMAATLVLVRKDQAAADFAKSRNWLIIIGTMVLLGIWVWSRRRRSAKLD